MENLLQEIEAQIAGVKTAAAKQNVGIIRELGDGVAKLEGLTDAMLNEMIDLGNGVTGLVLNLEETEVGVIILGDYTQLNEGGEARTTGKLLQVPVGKGLLGRVVNVLGQPVDGKGPIKSDITYPVEKIAPGIARRRSVDQPVQTGIMPIDAMIPIGHQPGPAQQSGRSGRRQGVPSAVLHLRRDQPEAVHRCASHSGTRRGRRDAVHHHRGFPGLGFRRQPVYRAVCRRSDRRVVHGQRDGCADRL